MKNERQNASTETLVSLNKITINPDVFQFRHVDLDPRHVDELEAVLKTGNTLDPLTLWKDPKAGELVVVDGHHRLAAYKQAGWKKKVPAVVHSCSVEDARLLALRENSKARLPLTKAERMDAAWQLVCLNHPEYSKKVIRETTGVGDGTVANMRRTRKALLERGTDPDFLPAHWWQALAELKHQSRRELTDDEREEMIEAKAAQLDAKIGNDLGFMAAHQIEAACIVVAKRLGKQGMSYLIDEHWEDEDLSDFPF